MANITTLPQLHAAISTWFQDQLVGSRCQSTSGTSSGDKTRQWATIGLGYKDKLIQSAMRAFVDRSQLNKDYNTKYNSPNSQDKKSVVLDKIEITTLYSFLKCFVERHKTRLMYYRDDLSQKGARNMYSVKISEDWWTQVRQELQS
jgi:hypothetical protein